MSGVELGISLVGVIDVCYRYGKSLVATCQAFKNADTRLAEHSVRVEACWLRIDTQLQVVRSLATVMDDRHRLVQQRIIEVLQTKLQIADSKLTGMFKPSSDPSAGPESVEARRWKYAILKDGLVEAISDLESWQGVFDPSWFLLMRIASPEIDSQLEASMRQQPAPYIPAARRLRGALKAESDTSKSTMFLRPDGLAPNSIHPIPFSPISTARRAANGQVVLLDPVTFTSRPSLSTVLKDIRTFSRKLQHASPFTFGLLECKGILKSEDKTSQDSTIASNLSNATTDLSFVFRLPATHSEVQGLRWRLLNWSENQYGSLSDRFALARQLVRAVSYVHTYGFVHKNIRPETILVICSGKSNSVAAGRDEGEWSTETAVLVGFDVIRDADGKTNRVGDDKWEKNVYRHPQRQSSAPEVDYEMRHDIYSIGVCLLEIGLWESFVVYDKKGESQIQGGHDVSTPTITSVAQPGPGLGLCESDMSKSKFFWDPDRIKDHLLQLARGKLRCKMGTRYSRVVETCLTCLDDGNVDFGDEKEFHDDDGVAVGARYIEKVVAKLGDIVV